MSEVDKIFEELGYWKIPITTNVGEEPDTLIYKLKDNYKERTISFDLRFRTYHVNFMWFVLNKNMTWAEQETEKNDFIKHSCCYGHWESEFINIDMSLHRAINKKCQELGWIV